MLKWKSIWKYIFNWSLIELNSYKQLAVSSSINFFFDVCKKQRCAITEKNSSITGVQSNDRFIWKLLIVSE